MHSHSPLNASHSGLQCVLTPWKPPFNPTDAQRLTRGYCGLKQRKSTVKHKKKTHTECWWETGQTDWLQPQTTGFRRGAAANRWKVLFHLIKFMQTDSSKVLTWNDFQFSFLAALRSLKNCLVHLSGSADSLTAQSLKIIQHLGNRFICSLAEN